MTAPESELIISYEGPGTGGELWGATQAYFVVDRPHQPAREVAILLNDAAAVMLAEQLGAEDTEEFRAKAARAAGEAWIRKLIETGVHLAPSIFVSAGTLREHPELVEAVRAAL